MMELEEKELKRAKDAAYRFLTYRPRSRKEIAEKLRNKGFAQDIIEPVIAGLTRLGYIDDGKFAAQWASGRLRLRGYGRRRIEQELIQKGIDRETIHAALADAFTVEDEREAAKKAAGKKLRTMKLVDAEVRRRRLAGFLERKGFSSAIIRDMLKDNARD